MLKKEKIISFCEKVIYWVIIFIPFAMSFSSALLNIMIGWLITAYFFKKLLSKDYWPVKTVITVPYLFLMLVSIFSIRNSDYFGASIQGLVKLLKHGFSFLIIAECIKDLKHFKRVIISLILGLLLASVDGIYQLAFGIDFLRRQAYDSLIGIPRLKAAFPHTNIYGLYLALISPVCIALTLHFYKGKKKLFFMIVSMLSIFCLIFTFSRGTAIGFLLSVIIIAILKKDKLLLLLIIIALIIGPFMLPSTVKDWAKEQKSFMAVLLNSSGGRDREFIYKTSLNMIKHHPFIGVGVNTFSKNYPHYKVNQIEGNTGDREYYAHNNFLHIAGEIGFIGLVIFFWLLFALFKKWYTVYRSLKENSFLGICNVGLFCGIIAFLVNGLTESGLYYSKTAAIFWIVIGIMLAVFSLAGKQELS